MKESYLNSVNLNSANSFPYLCMDVEKGRSLPEPPGFHVMHWHEDFQFLYVLKGELYFHTLDQTQVIHAGNGVFINKNVVHLVLASPECHYKSILFPERLVSFYAGGPGLDYVKRISDCPQITALSLTPEPEWQRTMLETLKKLASLSETAPCYEYEVLVLLSRLWLTLVQNIVAESEPSNTNTVTRMRCFLNYIELHYSENLTLDILAKSANVSKSECLRCFKLTMQDTPYHYLTEYRLAKAAELLTGSNLTINEISTAVGFHAQSHFGKLFRQKTGLSPKDYRKSRA